MTQRLWTESNEEVRAACGGAGGGNESKIKPRHEDKNFNEGRKFRKFVSESKVKTTWQETTNCVIFPQHRV